LPRAIDGADTARMNRSLILPYSMAVLTALLAACATLGVPGEAPRITLIGLRPLDIQILEQRYRVRLRIQNPNDAPLRIRGMDFKLRVNGKRFADGVSNRVLEVPAFGEALLAVDVSSSLVRLFEQLRGLGDGAAPRWDYVISGRLAIEGVPAKLPFERKGTLDLSVPDKARGQSI